MTHKSLAIAVEATKRICIGVAGSDFLTHYGTHAAYGLRDYKLDLAVDIFETIESRPATEEEKIAMRDMDWGIVKGRDDK
jgi:hypothetical protein